MNETRSYITLDFQNTHMPVIVKCRRGDTARSLGISLADGGVPYRIAEGCYATFTAKKPDKTVINNSCTIENNLIVYTFTEQTAAAVGRMTAEIRLYGSDGRMLTTASFILEVYKTVFSEDAVLASESEMNALDALILETLAVKKATETVKDETETVKEEILTVKDETQAVKEATETVKEETLTVKDETQALKDEVERKLAAGEFKGDPGLSQGALRLLFGILQEALFASDQSASIAALAVEMGLGTDVPQEPAPEQLTAPVIYLQREMDKLAAPVIRLETAEDSSGEDTGTAEQTPAILGVAVLGRTILGDYGDDLPQLGTPVISLVTVEDETEEPVLEQLATPVIELVVLKLATPVIKLETEE